MLRRVHSNSANLFHGRSPLFEINTDLILAHPMPPGAVHTNKRILAFRLIYSTFDEVVQRWVAYAVPRSVPESIGYPAQQCSIVHLPVYGFTTAGDARWPYYC